MVRFRGLVTAAIAFTLALATLGPGVSLASSRVEQLNKKLSQIKQEMEAKKKKNREVEQAIASVSQDIGKMQTEIRKLDLQMEETMREMEKLNQEIDKTETQAQAAARRLDEAEKRVAERDQLLKTRVRAIYETGDVSYLEVLMNAESVGDFLSRLDFVQRIVDSDVKILEQNKKDREIVAQEKARIEALLAKLQNQYAKLEEMKANYDQQIKKKQVTVAALKEQEAELEELNEELEKELAQLAAQSSQLMAEIKQLQWSGAPLLWPVPASERITSRFGYRTHPIKKERLLHSGIDIGAPVGTAIVAAEDGYVVLAEYFGGFGNTVMINHGGGIVTLYGHIRTGGILVKKGEYVKRGQKIAEVGSTGLSTGPHLHFSVIKDGQYVDPMKYLKN